jgi:hypothetical protein
LILAAGSALALSGCAYGDLGLGLGGGYGSPYGTYGTYGYGSPYYGGYGSPYGGYGYGPYGGYGTYPGYYGGFGYGMPYYGWNDGYYYPGSGYYVYDANRQAYPMTSSQQTYWMSRQPKGTTTTPTTTTPVKPNWSGFSKPPSLSPSAQQRLDQRRADAAERRADRVTMRAEHASTRADRESARAERISTRATSDTDTTDRTTRRRPR